MAGIASSAPGFDVALTALRNFRYEALEMTLDGAADGEIHMVLRLQGANPDLEDGRPVDFNLTVDAELADLIEAGAVSARIPEVIGENLRAFAERSRLPRRAAGGLKR